MERGQGSVDRRKHRRYAVQGAVDMRAAGIEIPLRAFIEDLSLEGCRLDMRVRLKIDHTVRLELPMVHHAPLVVVGRVIHAYGTTVDNIYHYGTRFRSDGEKKRLTLNAAIEQWSAGIGGTLQARVPAEICLSQGGHFQGFALAVTTSRMQLASDRVLPQASRVKVDINLPASHRQDREIVTVDARVLPGVKQQIGAFVHDLELIEPSFSACRQIEGYAARASA